MFSSLANLLMKIRTDLRLKPEQRLSSHPATWSWPNHVSDVAFGPEAARWFRAKLALSGRPDHFLLEENLDHPGRQQVFQCRRGG